MQLLFPLHPGVSLLVWDRLPNPKSDYLDRKQQGQTISCAHLFTTQDLLCLNYVQRTFRESDICFPSTVWSSICPTKTVFGQIHFSLFYLHTHTVTWHFFFCFPLKQKNKNKHISLNIQSLISVGRGLYSQSCWEKKSIDLRLLFESDGHRHVSDRLKWWNALGCIPFIFYEYRPRTIEWEFETIIWSKMYRFNLCFNTLTYTIHTHTHTHTHTQHHRHVWSGVPILI